MYALAISAMIIGQAYYGIYHTPQYFSTLVAGRSAPEGPVDSAYCGNKHPGVGCTRGERIGCYRAPGADVYAWMCGTRGNTYPGDGQYLWCDLGGQPRPYCAPGRVAVCVCPERVVEACYPVCAMPAVGVQ